MDNVIILLDRDGTLNRNYEKGPVYRLDLFELLPGAAKAVRIFNDLGVRVAVVTNQGGINHADRDFDWDTYHEIEKLMIEKLQEEAGAVVEEVFVCHHADYENCACRKPAVGMLKNAYDKYCFNPESSFIVGDSAADIIAGKNFGMNTILVESGWDKTVVQQLAGDGISPDYICADLLSAAEFISKQIK